MTLFVPRRAPFDLFQTNSGPCVYEKGWRLFQGVWTLFSLPAADLGADFTRNSLLTFCPDLLHFPTTSGEHCTGDVTFLGEAIGIFTIDLE